MDTRELISKLRDLGITIPAGTLRRWASEGLIPAPKRIGQKGKRGSFTSWPENALEQAAAVYLLRRDKSKNIPWAKTKQKTLLAAKNLVDRFYAFLEQYQFIEDPDFRKKLNQLLEQVPSSYFASPEGTEGSMYGGATLHPLVVTWIATLEKIRCGKDPFTPSMIIFNLSLHTFLEDDKRVVRVNYDGVTIEPSDVDGFNVILSHTAESMEKQRIQTD